MGEKDLSTKYLETYNDVFADIFNVLVFHEDYVEEALLMDGSTEESISPIVSIVLYFGDGNWKKPLSLHDMIPHMPEQVKPYVNDYPIHVIDVKEIPKKLRSKLKSDFKVIADFFAEKDDENYTPSDDAIRHPEAVLHMLRVFTDDKRYDDIEESVLLDKQEGKVITMCNFAERMEQKGRQEGESLLAEAIRALKSGKNVDELLKIYSQRTLDLAQEFV